MAADAIIEAEVRELASTAGDWPAVVARWRELEPAWLDALEQEKAPATVRAYAGRLDRFLAWAVDNPPPAGAAGTPVAAIRERVRSWLGSLDCGAPGRNLARAAVRSFTLWGFDRGHLHLDPLAGFRSEPVARSNRRESLSDDDAARLLEVAEADETPPGRRAWAIIALMLYSGIRTVEARRARIGDLSTRGGRRILYVHGKGRRAADDYVVIHAEAKRALRAWMAEHPDATNPDAPLFPSLSVRSYGRQLSGRAMRETLTTRLERAGVHGPRRTVHSLRHTAITAALRGGADLRQAQAMARHASQDMTARYAHDLERADDPAELRIRYDMPENTN